MIRFRKHNFFCIFLFTTLLCAGLVGVSFGSQEEAPLRPLITMLKYALGCCFNRESLDAAIRSKNLKRVEWILWVRPDLCYQALYGDRYALGQAIRLGSVPFVKLLLAAGADPNITYYNKVPFIFYAVDSRQEEIVRMLLNAGADCNAQRPSTGTTVLCHAVEMLLPKVVTELLAAGANVNAEVIRKTALSRALQFPLHEQFEDQIRRKKIVTILLAHGAEIDATVYGKTPVQRALSKESPEIIECLIPRYVTVSDDDKKALDAARSSFGYDREVAAYAEKLLEERRKKLNTILLDAKLPQDLCTLLFAFVSEY